MSDESKTEYVIMLDDYLKDMPNDWPVVYTDPTLLEAQAHQQFISTTDIRPRQDYCAEFLEDKSLIQTQDGESYTGGIYKMTPS